MDLTVAGEVGADAVVVLLLVGRAGVWAALQCRRRAPS